MRKLRERLRQRGENVVREAELLRRGREGWGGVRGGAGSQGVGAESGSAGLQHALLEGVGERGKAVAARVEHTERRHLHQLPGERGETAARERHHAEALGRMQLGRTAAAAEVIAREPELLHRRR